MNDRKQWIQAILCHNDCIEDELGLLRQLVMQLAENNDEMDQDLILVDAELAIHEAVAQPAPVVPEPRDQDQLQGHQPMRHEIHQDSSQVESAELGNLRAAS